MRVLISKQGALIIPEDPQIAPMNVIKICMNGHKLLINYKQ